MENDKYQSDKNGNKYTKNTNIRTYLEEYFEDSTIHGLRNICRDSYHNVAKFLWFLIILGMSIGCGYAIFQSFNAFLSHKTTTSSETIWEETLDFPKITFCNTNFLSKKRTISKYPNLVELLDKYLYTNLFQELNITDTQNVTEESTMKSFSNITIMKVFENGLLPVKDIFKYCQWINKIINCEDYITINTLGNAICYTFSSTEISNKSKLNFTVKQPGPEFGFSTTIDINQEDYLFPEPTSLHAAGFDVTIHDKNIVPVRTIGSFNVAPGYFYKIAISKQQVNRLQPPYAKFRCVEDKNYSYANCLANCQNYIRYKNCNCTVNSKGPDACQFNVLFGSCSDLSVKNYYLGKCNCRPLCSEITYEKQISSLSYPSDFALKYTKQYKNRTKEDLRNNLLHINMFFSGMEYTIITYNPAISNTQLVGDIGGQLGLCLGASFISLIEIFELIIKLLRNIIQKTILKRKRILVKISN